MLSEFIDSASLNPKRIVLAEGIDPRILDAAVAANDLGIGKITLLGNRATLIDELEKRGTSAGVSVVDPETDDRRDEFIAKYKEIRAGRMIAPDEAQTMINDRLGFAAMMVREGHADGTIAGAVSTTADTIRAALKIIGRAVDTQRVSSFFLMFPPSRSGLFSKPVLFADCALTIEPNENELAEIAINSARSAATFLKETPRVAMLSFSTVGSANNSRTEKVRNAVAIANSHWPTLEIEGEIQFDAAVDANLRMRKNPGSRMTGMPNVFVFPSLEAANIGYKIAERVGGMKAVGPILQGLAKPANDLSRGCTSNDILSLIAVTSAQAASINQID